MKVDVRGTKKRIRGEKIKKKKGQKNGTIMAGEAL